MPVLRHYKNRPGSYARAVIGQSIVTVSITGDGLERLKSAGFDADGTAFPQSLFNELLRQREAFTHAGARAEALENAEKEQYYFDFDADVAAQEQLPRCAETGTFQDLHLVVYSEPNQNEKITQLLGELPRKCLVAHVHLNLPLSLIDHNALQQLIEAQKVASDAPVIQQLASWLDQARNDQTPWETHDIEL
jgi:hypothetical protein